MGRTTGRRTTVLIRRLPDPHRLWVGCDWRGVPLPGLRAQTYGDLLVLVGQQYPGADAESYYRRLSPSAVRALVDEAVWAGDVDLLCEVAPCGCCCDEHTLEGCPARQWGGCRGQGSMTREDVESWVRHYGRYHGMTREEFFGGPG